MQGRGVPAFLVAGAALLSISLLFKSVSAALLLLFLFTAAVLSPQFSGADEAHISVQSDSIELREGDDAILVYNIQLKKNRVALCNLKMAFPQQFNDRSATGTFLVRGHAEIKVVIHSVPRGMHFIEGCSVRCCDVLAMSESVFTCPPVTLICRPRLERIKAESIEIRNTLPFPGNTVSAFRGGGSEFYAIRDYVEGENVRHINWKASGRTEELKVNEFLSERSGTVIFILDLRMVMGDRVLTQHFFDRILRASLALIYRSIAERNSVGAVVLTQKATILKPSTGRGHYLRLEQCLTEAVVPSAPSAYRIHRVPSMFLNPLAQYVVLSPVMDESTRDDLFYLMSEQRDVTVLVPLISPSQRNISGSADNIVLKLLRARQENNILQLGQFGSSAGYEGDSVQEAVETLRLASRRLKIRAIH